MKKEENQIMPVVDNNEKYISYKASFERYNKAKKQEFYFECIWILYAVLEDRASSFLYHIGFTSEINRERVTRSDRIKKEIRKICNMSKIKERYNFDCIAGKLKRIREVISWSVSDIEKNTDYEKQLAIAVKEYAINKEFTEALDYLEGEWRDKRNQLIHELVNKKPEMVAAEMYLLVDKGYTAIRVLDKSIRIIKKYGIREKYKII